MRTQLHENYKDRWQEFFEQALEECGLPSDRDVFDMDGPTFDMLSKRADELLADDEAGRVDAMEVK